MYYGQNKEDKIINELIIEKYGENYKGSILDLGANDGVTLSNSRFFIERGWSGVLIEAGRTPYERLLKSSLPNCININCAIGVENCELTFYESDKLLSINDVGLVSSLIINETERWRRSGINFIDYKVPCYNWNTLVENYGLQNKKFDIISIDIEGMDYDVLTQLDLNELDCKILCVEFNGKEMQKYVRYVSQFDMVLEHINGENLIFSKK